MFLAQRRRMTLNISSPKNKSKGKNYKNRLENSTSLPDENNSQIQEFKKASQLSVKRYKSSRKGCEIAYGRLPETC